MAVVKAYIIIISDKPGLPQSFPLTKVSIILIKKRKANYLNPYEKQLPKLQSSTQISIRNII
jgi:hypothetical protein